MASDIFLQQFTQPVETPLPPTENPPVYHGTWLWKSMGFPDKRSTSRVGFSELQTDSSSFTTSADSPGPLAMENSSLLSGKLT